MSRVTLADVSQRAGVSRSTASLVLRGSSRVSDETSERVKAAMRELGYVYNRQAANMRQGASMTLGFVATDIRNPFFAEVTMAFEDVVHAAGYTLFVGYSLDDLERQRQQVGALVQRQVDGLMILPAIGSSMDEFEEFVWTSKVPVVQVSRRFTDQLDYVGPNNFEASLQVAKHVASLGARTAVFVGGPTGSSAHEERLRGLSKGFAATSVDFKAEGAVATQNVPDAGAAGLAAYLDRGTLPDAVICYSDAIAQGVYGELRQRNLDPGTSVAVISFDDLPSSALQYPPLTSVATHAQTLGRMGAEMLLERIRCPERPATHEQIDATLRVRGSTAQWRPRSL